MHRISDRLTYANVISTLCLLLVLGGGTAYAASKLGKESVGARQLKKEAVTPAKLSTAAKATLTGPAGPKGATGATGPQGPQGTPGAAGATKIDVQVGPDGNGSFAHCPAGQVAVGGGGEADEGFLFVSEPVVGENAATAGQTPNGWFVKAEEVGELPTDAHAYVLCASP
ncbi:MAG TPA: hypothetical protein VHA76_07725 [Solirubrobacterales bacterium]|nr:hypothetical protein [Solirubrobacterales bacterium]